MSALDKDGKELKDGFRKRNKRPKGWEAKAIKAGLIPDPNAPEPAPRERQPGDVVVAPPVATGEGR